MNVNEEIVWYGLCTYWTDDWVTLGNHKGIPACPECGGVGFQMHGQEWTKGVAKYEAEGNPGYADFINEMKAKCHGKTTLAELWDQRKEIQKDEDAEIRQDVENEENA